MIKPGTTKAISKFLNMSRNLKIDNKKLYK